MLTPEQTPIEQLQPYKNNARLHSDEQVDQIAQSIEEFGFLNPVLVDDQYTILAGHGRVMGAKKLGLDTVPTIQIKHLSESQKKAYIIADNKIGLNSSWDEDLLKTELEAISELDLDTNLTGFSIKEVSKLFEDDGDKYTKKIETPSYQPNEEKPPLVDLYDKTKAVALLDAINASKVGADVKDFLRCAAYRHIEFNFEKIADFYAHSDKETKQLFEDSALVIIDFKDAIAKNFVQLNEELAKQYLQDNE